MTRARMLLYKQDIISQLEARLERVDRDETKPLFLGSRRRDANLDRQAVMNQLDIAMKEYVRTQQALNTKSAPKRSVRNLQDWINNFGCISREEVSYLDRDDLMEVAPSDADGFLESLATMVEDGAVWACDMIKG
ncbi:uncharacterized protein PG998_002494 [Apiospora kogelbergensis]|uniref:uncharacterized protein n=1 Tax=Apiospora kogelbergensis TaxID=1337665 RepID=UPI0031318718